MRPIEAMLAAFERVYRSRVPFSEDGALGPDLASEVRPILETMEQAARTFDGDASCHEAYALLTLFGRRVGGLGATPSAAMAVLAAMVIALNEQGVELTADFQGRLQLVLFEGYSAGRDERVSADLRESVARSQVALRLAPRCRYVALSGPLDIDALESTLDERAREFLRDDALVCLLDLSRMDCPPVELCARAVLEHCLACKSVGGSVIVTGVAPELLAALRALGFSHETATLADDFASGLRMALQVAGSELRPVRVGWTKALFARRA